jgi:hypothetical protein
MFHPQSTSELKTQAFISPCVLSVVRLLGSLLVKATEVKGNIREEEPLAYAIGM